MKKITRVRVQVTTNYYVDNKLIKVRGFYQFIYEVNGVNVVRYKDNIVNVSNIKGQWVANVHVRTVSLTKGEGLIDKLFGEERKIRDKMQNGLNERKENDDK